jgi:hypothetical protein
MAVVFDEVTGSVEPETRSATEETERAPTAEENEMKLRHLLCKLEQREERLRAD